VPVPAAGLCEGLSAAQSAFENVLFGVVEVSVEVELCRELEGPFAQVSRKRVNIPPSSYFLQALEPHTKMSLVFTDVPNHVNVKGGQKDQLLLTDNARSTARFQLMDTFLTIDKIDISSNDLASMLSIRLGESPSLGLILARMVFQMKRITHVSVAFEQFENRGFLTAEPIDHNNQPSPDCILLDKELFELRSHAGGDHASGRSFARGPGTLHHLELRHRPFRNHDEELERFFEPFMIIQMGNFL
jgi:hypothetical protein